MKSELNWRTTFEGYRNGGAKKKTVPQICVYRSTNRRSSKFPLYIW